MSSDSIDCVCAMLNHATGVLDTNFKDVLISHVKAGENFRNSVTNLYCCLVDAIQSLNVISEN